MGIVITKDECATSNLKVCHIYCRVDKDFWFDTLIK